MSIVLSAVSKKYDEQLAVNEVSFEASPGEIIGFLGPNGAGKSTTMKMITGYIPPSAGSITVCDLDVADNPIETKSRIGYLPEHNPLYLDMYVKEYLRFVARLRKIKNAKARIEEVIALTGLQKEQHKQIKALSKGYRQRVGLAQAIIHDPEVIILDEPTSGLDPNQLVEIRALIKTLGKDKTVLLSTHIMQEVEALCDRVIIIKEGRIVANDPVKNLPQDIRVKKTIVLELANPIEQSSLEAIDGIHAVHAKSENMYLLEYDAGTDPRRSIFQAIVEQNNVIFGLSQSEESIETIFQKLTRN